MAEVGVIARALIHIKFIPKYIVIQQKQSRHTNSITLTRCFNYYILFQSVVTWCGKSVTNLRRGYRRLCVPPKRAANQAISRERHVMPTLSGFKAEMNVSKYFSKIDLKQAYYQLELTEESRYITTFSTHEGLFRYKRLNYGTNSAGEIFQNILQRHLSDIQGVENIADDITDPREDEKIARRRIGKLLTTTCPS